VNEKFARMRLQSPEKNKSQYEKGIEIFSEIRRLFIAHKRAFKIRYRQPARRLCAAGCILEMYLTCLRALLLGTQL
jgi:hypothetical protein